MTIVTITDNRRPISTITDNKKLIHINTGRDPPNFYLENSILVGSGGVEAYQVVFMASDGTARPADSENPSHAGRILGIVKSSQAEGLVASIQIAGEIENPAWDLEVGDAYFLGSGGEITLTPPSRGFVQRIGVAKTPKKLVINLGEPVLR